MISYKVGEAARILNVSKNTLYALVKEGSIGFRVGDGVRISHQEIEKIMGEELEETKVKEILEAFRKGN